MGFFRKIVAVHEGSGLENARIHTHSRGESRIFPGGYTIDEEGPALETARSWRVRGTI